MGAPAQKKMPIELSQSEAVSLADLCPEEASVVLPGPDGNLKEYTVRPFDLDDRAWLLATFKDELGPIFEESRMEPICRILYHQFSPEDRMDFASQLVEDVNEDGEKVHVQQGGYKLLFKKVFGVKSQLEVYNALLLAIGISNPVITKIMKEEAKKKVTKKKSQKKSTGEQSST